MTHYDTATALALGLDLKTLEPGPTREMLPGARPGFRAPFRLPKLSLASALAGLFAPRKPVRPR